MKKKLVVVFAAVVQWLEQSPHEKKAEGLPPSLQPFWVEFVCFPCAQVYVRGISTSKLPLAVGETLNVCLSLCVPEMM